jgi:hypothetical protein
MRATDFGKIIAAMAPGTSAYLSTWRDGQPREVTLVLGSTSCRAFFGLRQVAVSNSRESAAAGCQSGGAAGKAPRGFLVRARAAFNARMQREL